MCVAGGAPSSSSVSTSWSESMLPATAGAAGGGAGVAVGDEVAREAKVRRRRCVSTDLRRIPTLRHPRTAMNAAATRKKFVSGDHRLQKVQPSGQKAFLLIELTP